AVVGLRTDFDAFDELAVFGIDNQKTAVGGVVPPSGRSIDLLAVQSDRGAVAARFIGFLPDGFFGLQIEGPQAVIAGREIETVCLEVSGEAADAFFEDRKIDAPDKLVPVIDIEDQNAIAGPALLLRSIG